MKKKRTKWNPKDLAKYLNRVFDKLYDPWRDCDQKLIGTAEWMRILFYCEALRGCIQSLNKGRPPKKAIIAGKLVASETIQAWSKKKPNRARKAEKLVGEFLEDKVTWYRKKHKEKK